MPKLPGVYASAPSRYVRTFVNSTAFRISASISSVKSATRNESRRRECRLKWLVSEQDSDKAVALLFEDLHAPDFFPVELTNALNVSRIRGRITDTRTLLG